MPIGQVGLSLCRASVKGQALFYAHQHHINTHVYIHIRTYTHTHKRTYIWLWEQFIRRLNYVMQYAYIPDKLLIVGRV
jgi:hypothetical protein